MGGNTVKGLFIGLLTIDIQFQVKKYPIENTKVKSTRYEIATGGPATNAAVAYCSLNGSASLLTSIGKNHFSHFIDNELMDLGISKIDISENIEMDPVFASVVTSGNHGDRTIFSYFPEKIIHLLPHKLEKELSDSKPDVILIDGFYPEIYLKLLPLIQKNNIPVIFDGGSWKPWLPEVFQYVDIAICSSNFHPPGCKNFDETISYLEDAGIPNIAISCGNEPIKYKDKKGRGEVSVSKVNAIDTLGAGDFLHGAFCYYLSIGNNFVQALTKAAEYASQSCRYFGTRKWLDKLN